MTGTRPQWNTFRCDCGEDLSFQTFDKVGEKTRVSCASCGRIWEECLTERGWVKTLVHDPSNDA